MLNLLVNAFPRKLRLPEEESRRDSNLDISSQTGPAAPQWETWELDKAFFTALSQWALVHPETTLDRAHDNISVGLENAKDLFSLIPNTPFPARGLVTALAHLFKLGVMISRAKKDVHEFARDVVDWVGEVKLAFESANWGEEFTASAWRDLRKMRDLVEEICRWALARLEDRRWTRVGHGLMIQKEIGEFRARIADARGLFQDLSAINLARGIDVIKRYLRNLLFYQRGILVEIKKVRKSQEQQLSCIIDEIEAQKLAAARERFLAQTLYTRSVVNPTYDEQGKRPCDDDTRVEVLAEIGQWVNDISPNSQNFLWLTGDPGCGKSAITASLARDCKDKQCLWAQFFINRNNVETTNPNSYFPSIARQLANHSPDVAKRIHDTLQEKLSLMDRISADQAAKLFGDAIQVASMLDSDTPVVVVIDGFDETDRSHLSDVAIIFATLFPTLAAYPNIKVFISSRTEDEIRAPFSKTLHNKHVKHIHLNTSDPSSIRDVSTFILRSLKTTVEKYDLNWEVWPGDRRAAALGDRASGLFIWAVTAIKLVLEQVESNGAECLDDVLDMLTADNLDDINTLYELILRLTFRSRASEWEFERFRRIIGTIVTLQEPLCLDDLAELLDLRKARDSDRVDMPHFFRRLRTVLVAGTDAVDGKTIPHLHKSFFEFITSTRVDTRFRVDPEDANLEFAVQCFGQFSDAHAAMNKDLLPVAVRYAYRFWFAHLSQTRQRNTMVVVHQKPAPLTQTASLLQNATIINSPVVLAFVQGKSQIQARQEDSIRTWDLASGHDITQHREGVSCLAFSPDSTQIVSCSNDKSIIFWDAQNGRWNRTINHSSSVLAVAFSPDGKYIVYGSSDYTVCLWDTSTGLSAGPPFRGHAGPVTCVAFSPDGKAIVSGSVDKTCRVWDVETGQPLGIRQYSSGVSSLAFGQDDASVIYSGFDDGTIRGWYMRDGDEIQMSDFSSVTSIACSSRSGLLPVSGSADGYTRHWDARVPIQRSSMKEHKGAILCVALSPDGDYVFSGSNNTICVSNINDNRRRTVRYDYHGRAPTKGQRVANPDRVTALAFSPDLKYFACAGLTVRVYELRFQKDDLELEIVPVDVAPPLQCDPLRPSLFNPAPSDVQGLKEELGYMLSNVVTGTCAYDANFRNRRLEGTRWFNPEQGNTSGSSVLWALFEKYIIKADSGDGLVTVWNRKEHPSPTSS